MKNFSIHYLTLMMAIMMVYAAPTKGPSKEKKLLLEQIKEEANKALKQNLPDLYVTKIEGNDKKCLEEFFCLADKALKNAIKNAPKNYPQKKVEHLSKLEHALHVYSNKIGIHKCDLNQDDAEYDVKPFLEHIVFCVDYELNNKTSS